MRTTAKMAFIGCVAEGRRSLETLLDLREEICAIFTLEPARAAKVSGAVRFDDLSVTHGIPLHYVRNMNDPGPVATLKALAPDLVFCVGWTQLLHREVLEIPRLGCIGFHASLLPRYRGRAPVNWAIIKGERESGNTMLLLDDGVDTGDIIAQRAFPISDDDTCATTYDKVAASEDEMIREVMPLLHQGCLPRRRQDDSRATLMPPRRPDDGRIAWRRPSRELHDWVRALTHPYPGAFTSFDGTPVFVWKARSANGTNGQTHPVRPGWWRVEGEPPLLKARTRDGDLVIERAQREGDEERNGLDFAARWIPAEGLYADEDGGAS